MTRFPSLPIIVGLLVICAHICRSQDSADRMIERITQTNSYGDLNDNLSLFDSLKSTTFLDDIPCAKAALVAHHIGVTYYYLDENLNAAHHYIENVIPLWESCQDKRTFDYAKSVYNTGVTLQFAERYNQSRNYFYKSIQLFESIEGIDSTELSKRYAGIGRFFEAAQDYVRAEDYLDLSIDLIRNNPKQIERKIQYTHDLAITLQTSGQEVQAIPLFESVIQHYQKTKNKRKLANTLHNAAVNYYHLSSFDKAFEYIEQAKSLRAANSYALSADLELEGLIYKKFGQAQEAKSSFEEAILILKNSEANDAILSSTYENISEIYEQIDLKQAISFIDSSIASNIINPRWNAHNNPLIKEAISKNHIDLIRKLGIKARILSKQDQNESTVTSSFDLFHKIDSLFTLNIFNLRFERSRLSYINLIYDNYNRILSYIADMHHNCQSCGYDKIAFEYASKAKAFVLQNEFKEREWYEGGTDNNISKDISSSVAKVHNLYAQIIRSKGNDPELTSQYLAAQRELELELIRKDDQSENSFDHKYNLLEPLKIGEIQSALTSNQVYVEFSVVNKGLISFWISKDAFEMVIHQHDDILDQRIEEFNQLVRDRNSSMNEIRKLGASLFDSLLPLLKNESFFKSELIIVPDGPLHQLSFDLLPAMDNKFNFLIEQLTITLSYSSHLLFNGRSTAINSDYIGFGTQYSEEIGNKYQNIELLKDSIIVFNLYESENEISVSHDLMGGQSFIGAKATKDAFTQHLKSAGIVHLSLHGFVHPDYYERSCLIFDDRSEDHLLLLSDLYTMDHESDLVVLSSCYTAAGKLFKGEGIQGLTKSFLKTGRTTVVSSLWEASDYSSSLIIPSFFSFLKKGETISSSLQQAKIAYLDSAPPSQQHPYYWANFQIIGKGDQKIASRNHLHLLLSGALLFFGFLYIFRLKFNR